jgi:hypothetical protein
LTTTKRNTQNFSKFIHAYTFFLCFTSYTLHVDPTECLSTEISCDEKCLPSIYKCDGVTDCDDGTDEENCPENPGSKWFIL